MENLGEKTFALLESTGLNWSVEKLPLTGPMDRETNSFGIFRRDNDKWMGTVGNQYQPYQNSDMAELIVQAADGVNIEVTRGGELFGGKKVYLQAELPTEFIGNSDVKRWITALNSHDGSTSIAFGSSNTTVVCQNTFYRAYGEMEKVRHTTNAKDRLEIMMLDLRKSIGLDIQLMESFKRMADLELKDEAMERVLRKIFKVETDTDVSNVSTRKKNIITDFGGAVVQSKKEQGNTIWALFNSVTRYTNHIAAPKEKDKKQEYIMGKKGAKISNVAYDEIMKWVEENTAKVYATV